MGYILEIKNLSVEANENHLKIIHNLSIKFPEESVSVIMGPNGSGKSSLCQTIIGNPEYSITDDLGDILFFNESIKSLKVNERALKGIFVSFQNPVEVAGVSIASFLRQSYFNKFKDKKFNDFKEELLKSLELLKLDNDFITKSLNENLSGGEKKKSEILQLLLLKPKLAILDEIDSGLDIDALRIVSNAINTVKNQGTTIILVTHYKRLTEYIDDIQNVFVIMDGELKKTGDKKLIEELEKNGYKAINS